MAAMHQTHRYATLPGYAALPGIAFAVHFAVAPGVRPRVARQMSTADACVATTSTAAISICRRRMTTMMSPHHRSLSSDRRLWTLEGALAQLHSLDAGPVATCKGPVV